MATIVILDKQDTEEVSIPSNSDSTMTLLKTKDLSVGHKGVVEIREILDPKTQIQYQACRSIDHWAH
jgi:hypothetical protein